MKSHHMKTEVELLQYFELNLLSSVTSDFHKRPIVWQDLFDAGVDLPETAILDLWKEWIMPQSLDNATAAGYDVLFSACWYLDHLNEGWWEFHKCNPRGIANLSTDQEAHILGGHASMWGERVDSSNFFERVWPRLSAVSEVLWSGSPSNHDDLSSSLVQGRLERFRCLMIQQFDIPASPIAPGYCGHGPISNDNGAPLLPPLVKRPHSELTDVHRIDFLMK
jgi:hexosaminidase